MKTLTVSNPNKANFLKKLSLVVGTVGLAASCATFAASNTETDHRFQDGWKEGKVETIFLLNPYLNNFKIDAEVKGDAMVLTGEVDEDIDRDLAEAVAMGVGGIKSVENRITVSPDNKPASKQQDSGEISLAQHIQDITTTTLIKGKLVSNSNISGLAIHVDTSNGLVTLPAGFETA